MPRITTPPSIRFWRKVRGGDFTECWLWTAQIMPNGYGRFGITPGQTQLAHRFAYEDMRAPIPAGLQIDHLCRNRLCVNPWHLEPVTADVNLKRVPTNQANRTHCPEGHEYTGTNVYTCAQGKRTCRTCHAARQREYRRKRRQAAA